jgi:hypothetical protein
MEKRKIRLSLPLDLVVALYHNMETNETFDQTLDRYLRIALKAEGKL